MPPSAFAGLRPRAPAAARARSRPARRRSSRNWPSRSSRPTTRRAPRAPTRPPPNGPLTVSCPTGAGWLARWSRPSDEGGSRRPGGSPGRCSSNPATGASAQSMRQSWQDVRYGLRWLGQHRGIHRGGAAHPGTDDRRQLGDLQPGQRGAAGAAAVPRRRRTGGGQRGAPALGFPRMPFSPLDYQDYAAGQKSLSALAIYRNGSVELAGEGESERIDIAKVSPSIFDVLQVQPALGRALRADDARPAATLPSSATRTGPGASMPTARWSAGPSSSIASR